MNSRIGKLFNFTLAFKCSENYFFFSNQRIQILLNITSGEEIFLEKQEGRSLPLGILNPTQLTKQSKEYKNMSIHLGSAQKIIFYTDGLLEQSIEDSEGKFVCFEDKILSILKNIKDKPNFFDLLLDEFNQFSSGKEQMDDICIIAVDLL
jgi:serine phosphatase RsbU (regulator of sigma subunit)